MRLASLARLALLWGLFAGAVAVARPPQEFKAPTQMTEEEIAASKARSKSGIAGYGKDVPQTTKPFPWKAAALFAIVFAVAAPFAIRQYLTTAKELGGGNKTFRAKSPASDD